MKARRILRLNDADYYLLLLHLHTNMLLLFVCILAFCKSENCEIHLSISIEFIRSSMMSQSVLFCFHFKYICFFFSFSRFPLLCTCNLHAFIIHMSLCIYIIIFNQKRICITHRLRIDRQSDLSHFNDSHLQVTTMT